MRILILDDSEAKCYWIKNILEDRSIEYEQVSYLNGAYQRVFKIGYDGIILDMQFPILMDSMPCGNAGVLFLDKLKRRNIQIPVLGHSIIRFPDSKEYPFLKGKIEGFRTLNGENLLLKFLEDIKEQTL